MPATLVIALTIFEMKTKAKEKKQACGYTRQVKCCGSCKYFSRSATRIEKTPKWLVEYNAKSGKPVHEHKTVKVLKSWCTRNDFVVSRRGVCVFHEEAESGDSDNIE